MRFHNAITGINHLLSHATGLPFSCCERGGGTEERVRVVPTSDNYLATRAALSMTGACVTQHDFTRQSVWILKTAW